MPGDKVRKPVRDGKFDQNLVTVGTKIQVPRRTLELLRDVALFRHLHYVAENAKTQSVKFKVKPDISDVITELVENNRAALEIELNPKVQRKIE